MIFRLKRKRFWSTPCEHLDVVVFRAARGYLLVWHIRRCKQQCIQLRLYLASLFGSAIDISSNPLENGVHLGFGIVDTDPLSDQFTYFL